MELLKGETLRTKIASRISPRKAVDYAAQIASGLAAAHERGVIHRDLKPENVMINDDHVKILDFGLAKLRALAFESRITRAIHLAHAAFAERRDDAVAGRLRRALHLTV